MTSTDSKRLKPSGTKSTKSKTTNSSQICLLIISAQGEVLFSTYNGKDDQTLFTGDLVFLTRESLDHSFLIQKISGGKQTEIHINNASVFDLEIRGKKANLIVINGDDLAIIKSGQSHPALIESLINIMPGMAYQRLNDELWTMTYLNEGCASLTGYQVDELINKSKLKFGDLIHHEDRIRVWEEIQTALAENRPYQLSYRIIHSSGEIRFANDNGKGIFNKKGKLIMLEGWIFDVTERKHLEDVFVENEARYKSLIQTSPDAIVLADLGGNIIYTNQQLANMLEIEKIDSLIGNNVLDYIVENSRRFTKRDIISTLTGDQTHRGIYDIQTKNGQILPVEVNIRSVNGTDGKQTAYIGIVRDVREREQTMEALKTSEARYRAIVEDSPEMIVRYSSDGIVTFANQAYCNFYGLNPSDLIGFKLTEKVPETSRKTIELILAFLSPGMAPATKEHASLFRNGELHWYRWKTQPIHNDEGRFIEFQSVGEDITDEKKAEKNRHQSESHLRTLMESIKLIAIILDIQGTLTFCNSHFLELTGWTKEDAIGKNWLEYFVPPEVALPLKKVLIESAISGNIPLRYENMIITRKGDSRLISWNNTLLRDDHGVVTAIASIGEDITERFYTEKTQEVIYKISQSTNTTNNLDDLYQSIHSALMGLMPAENFFIALYDSSKDLLSFPYYIDQFDTQPIPQKPGRGLTEYVLRTGKTLLANPEVFNLLIEENEVESIGAPSVDWMGVPLRIENEVIGVMVLQSYSEGVRFKKRDEQMITFVSSQVAMAIQRKRSEQALRTSQERSQLLVDASTDGIILETVDGQILDFNQIIEEMYGYSRKELLSMRVIDLVSPDYSFDKPNYVEWELEQGGRLNNIPNIRKDGTVFPVEVSTRLTQVEDNQFVVAYVRDITEQKKVERAILESESKFRTLAQTTAAGIFIHRGEKYLYVNPMWSEITGYSEEDLLKMGFWDAITPENVDSIKQTYIDRIREGTVSIRYETVIYSKIGEKKWLDITAGMIDYEGEKATIGTAIDISHRKQREHELEVVAHISEALRITLTRDEIRPTILKELMDLLEIDGALISTIENDKDLYTFERAVGCWSALDNVTLRVSDGLSGFILVSGKTYVNNHAAHDPHFAFPELVQRLTSIAGVPLITKGESIGTILIGSTRVLTDNELRLLKTIGDLAASAIHRSDLYEQTSKQAHELKQAYDATLEGWAHALELRDKETQGHSLRIAKMTLALAKKLGYKDEDLENVRRGALLHDIGKMGVPDTILLKPGSLNTEEWEIMRKHPVYAAQMLSELPYFKKALDIPYCHHEWWDGSGYPRGLMGNEIPLVARIFAIVDAWDALISDRPYRKAWMKREALSHIIDQSGTHFDPEVVNGFVQMLKDEKSDK